MGHSAHRVTLATTPVIPPVDTPSKVKVVSVCRSCLLILTSTIPQVTPRILMSEYYTCVGDVLLHCIGNYISHIGRCICHSLVLYVSHGGRHICHNVGDASVTGGRCFYNRVVDVYITGWEMYLSQRWRCIYHNVGDVFIRWW